MKKVRTCVICSKKFEGIKNNTKTCSVNCRQIHRQKYYQSPEAKEKQKLHNQREYVKEMKRQYQQRPEVKKKIMECYQRPEIKEKQRQYYKRYNQKNNVK